MEVVKPPSPGSLARFTTSVTDPAMLIPWSASRKSWLKRWPRLQDACMLLISIVALIATTAFYRQAKTRGMQPGKAASIPFVAAGIFLITGIGFASILNRVALAVYVGPGTVRAILLMANVFLLLGYLQVIHRNWQLLANTVTGTPQDEQG